jgi:hypothetical protein
VAARKATARRVAITTIMRRDIIGPDRNPR